MKKLRIALCVVLLLAMSIFISFASEEGINLNIKDSYFLESYITGEITVLNGDSPASGETVTYKLSDYKNTQLIDVGQLKTDNNGKIKVHIGIPSFAKRGLYVLTIRHNDDVLSKEIVILDGDDRIKSHKDLGSMQIEKNETFSLPQTVLVKTARGEESSKKIIWVEIPSSSNTGGYTAVGLVDDYYKVTYTVFVRRAESNSDNQSSGSGSDSRPTGTTGDNNSNVIPEEKPQVVIKDEELPKSNGTNVDFSKVDSIIKDINSKSAKELKAEVKAFTDDVSAKINENGIDKKTITNITNSSLNLTKEMLKKNDLTYNEAKDVVEDVISVTVKNAFNKDMDQKDVVKVKNEVKDLIRESLKLAGRVNVNSSSKVWKVELSDVEKALEQSKKAMSELVSSASKAGIKIENATPIIEINAIRSNGDMLVDLQSEIIKASEGSTLEITDDDITFELDKNILARVSSDSKNKISISSNNPSSDLMSKIKSDAKGRKIGVVRDLKYSVSDNGNLSSELMPNIQISVGDLINSGSDINKFGVYVYDENTGAFEIVKSKLVDNKLVFKAPHFSVYTVMETDIEFTDMNGHWAKNTVEELAAKGYINEKDNNKFEPNKKITRAEFVTMLANVLELKESKATNFTDVKADSWYSSKVAAAFEAGLVKGDDKGHFNPDSEVSRQDMAVLISRAFKMMYGEDMSGDGEMFNDNSKIAEYSLQAVIGAKHHGIISGYEDNTFKPNDFASRAEASKMIQNLINY